MNNIRSTINYAFDISHQIVDTSERALCVTKRTMENPEVQSQLLKTFQILYNSVQANLNNRNIQYL